MWFSDVLDLMNKKSIRDNKLEFYLSSMICPDERKKKQQILTLLESKLKMTSQEIDQLVNLKLLDVDSCQTLIPSLKRYNETDLSSALKELQSIYNQDAILANSV